MEGAKKGWRYGLLAWLKGHVGCRNTHSPQADLWSGLGLIANPHKHHAPKHSSQPPWTDMSKGTSTLSRQRDSKVAADTPNPLQLSLQSIAARTPDPQSPFNRLKQEPFKLCVHHGVPLQRANYLFSKIALLVTNAITRHGVPLDAYLLTVAK
jgi:hypothetical protein